MNTKNYKVRFYCGKVGLNGQDGLVSEIFQSLTNIKPLPQLAIGGVIYQLRDFKPHNNGAVFQGVLAVLRDDAPHIVDGQDAEKEIELQVDEKLLEKNHFLYFKENELLVWQVNARASHISRFEQYLSNLKNKTIVFDDIVTTSSLKRIQNGIIKRFEMRIARPKNAMLIDPNNWGDKAFAMMDSAMSSTIAIQMSVRGENGLSAKVKESILPLLKKPEIRSLKVRLDGETEAIDLIADCIHHKIDVQMEGLYPVTLTVFAGLQSAKDAQSKNLADFFGGGNAILE
jgi:hypothetical protein